MRKNPILLVGFTVYTDKGLSIKMNFIIDSMTDNADYPDVGAKLTDCETAYSDLLAVYGQKGKVLNYTELRNNARKACYLVLKAMGTYITDKYPNNALKWQTSGYDVQTFDGNTQIPLTPEGLKLTDGANLGDLSARYSKSNYAIFYELRHWKKGETVPNYVTKVVRGVTAKFTGLDAGGIYYVQVRANGTKGTSDWCTAQVYLLRNVAEA